MSRRNRIQGKCFGLEAYVKIKIDFLNENTQTMQNSFLKRKYQTMELVNEYGCTDDKEKDLVMYLSLGDIPII